MTRRHPAALVAATLSLAAIVAACGGTPAASPLSDPVAILEAAATNAATATSVRIDVAADGELNLDLMGTGSGAPISLADTTATLEADIADGALKGTFALPGVLGLRGEVIVVDDMAYMKTSLTGPLFQATPVDGDTPGGAAGTGGSPDPSAVAEMVAGLREALSKPGVDPVKGEDVPCGSSTCYTVSIQLTPEEIAALGAEAGEIPLPSDLPIPVPGLPELGDQTVDLTVRVTTDTNDLAGLTVRLDDGAEGVVTAEVTFSDWDADLTITAPPADQIQGS
jgi:hypothetical protein